MIAADIKALWIADIQIYQKNAGVEPTPTDRLERAWEDMDPARQRRVAKMTQERLANKRPD